jgi:hypothetical protein
MLLLHTEKNCELTAYVAVSCILCFLALQLVRRGLVVLHSHRTKPMVMFEREAARGAGI